MQQRQTIPRRSRPVHRSRRVPVLCAVIAALAAVTTAGTAGPGKSVGEPPPLCTANVMHPIQVRVTALDPIRRGSDLRLQVTAIAARELGHVQVRMLSD